MENKTKNEQKAEPLATPSKNQSKEKKLIVGTLKNSEDCKDRNCNVHGHLKTRGRIFEGKVIKKFQKRVVIEFERMIYVRKYERYTKKKTKIHARLPICMEDQINIGDLITVQECRPISKIVHFVFKNKIKSKNEIKHGIELK